MPRVLTGSVPETNPPGHLKTAIAGVQNVEQLQRGVRRGFQLRYVMAAVGKAKAIDAAGGAVIAGAAVAPAAGGATYGTRAPAAAATLVAGAGGRAAGNAGLGPGGTRATLAVALGGALVVAFGSRVAGGMMASLSIPLPRRPAILD